MLFDDRIDAGRHLADRLAHLRDSAPVVLGLPRGGVPVAYQVARRLDAPLDVVIVRKLGVPGHHELAMGALGEGGVVVVNDDVIARAGIDPRTFDAAVARERVALGRRVDRLRTGSPPFPLAGRTAVLVDDGIATGATARAACQVARAAGAARVVLAVPVAPPGTIATFRDVADEIVCLSAPESFVAVGQWYADFAPVGDEEVVALLDASRRRLAERMATIDVSGYGAAVVVRTRDAALPGHLTVPAAAPLTVVFAHGSGSSGRSPRNRYVASVLNDAGLGTLLFDLLTADEARDRANVFDVPLLGRRLAEATAWLRGSGIGPRRVGYFGASTGAAAALWAAAEPGADVVAIVSRGGRPDLAGPRLAAVRAPTLLVVGAEDRLVLELNRAARRELHCACTLSVVPGATHLFEEPGTLTQAAHLARDWFADHAARVGRP